VSTHQLELSDLKIAWCSRMASRVLESMRGREFTSDDLHDLLPDQPESPNWFGVAMAQLRNSGLIERTGYKPSDRPARNGGIVSVWRVKEA